MIEIFSSPRVDRSVIARKMLVHILIAFAILGICVAMLFISIGKDSQANRDVVHKNTSSASEMWLVITMLVTIAATFYISVIGCANAYKIRRQFSNWVFYKQKLYYVAAAVPYGSTNIHRINRIIKTQDKILKILDDKAILIKILEKEVESDDICVIEVEKIDKIEQSRNGLKVRFGYNEGDIGREVCGYERLASIVEHMAER